MAAVPRKPSPQIGLRWRPEGKQWIFDEARLRYSSGVIVRSSTLRHHSLLRHIHFSSARLSSLTSRLWRDGEAEERKGKCRVFPLWDSNPASALNGVVSNVLFHQRISCLRYLLSFVFSHVVWLLLSSSRIWPQISPGCVSGHRDKVSGLGQRERPRRDAQRLPRRSRQPEGAGSIPVRSAGAAAQVRSWNASWYLTFPLHYIFSLKSFVRSVFCFSVACWTFHLLSPLK